MSTGGYLLRCAGRWKLNKLMVEATPPTALAARLRQALDLCGKQQTDLAALFDISDAAVSKWLKTGKVGRDRLPELARFLGVNLQWLAEGIEPMKGNALTKDERELIETYRALDDDKRPMARMFISAMVSPAAIPQAYQTPQTSRANSPPPPKIT